MKTSKLLLLILIFVFVSCTEKTILNSTQEVDAEKWNLCSPVDFNIDVKDTLSTYDCFISVRHAKTYEWSNLFLFIKTTYPNKEYSIDTVECILADLSGRWNGSGLGRDKDIQFLFKHNIQFPMQGNYQFEIQQGMREDEIKGIKNIGLKIIENNSVPHETNK